MKISKPEHNGDMKDCYLYRVKESVIQKLLNFTI
jgi:hypothetical protein